jgi:hypothetical protein
MEERRAHLRGQVTESLRVIEKDSGSWTGELKNLSVEGMKVLSKTPVETECVMECMLEATPEGNNSSPICFDAKVKWCNSTEIGMYEIGLQFTKVDAQSRHGIVKLLSTCRVAELSEPVGSSSQRP